MLRIIAAIENPVPCRVERVLTEAVQRGAALPAEAAARLDRSVLESDGVHVLVSTALAAAHRPASRARDVLDHRQPTEDGTGRDVGTREPGLHHGRACGAPATAA